MFDRRGHASVSQVHIDRSSNIVRYEHRLVDPPEISIMDYDKLKEYRIYDGDKIYFETAITGRLENKVQREGILRLEANPIVVEQRVLIHQETLEGHPCDFIVLVRSIKDRKDIRPDFTWIWEATDLDRQPLRVAYYQTSGSLVVINYKEVKLGNVDPALLKPPSEYISMNPY